MPRTAIRPGHPVGMPEPEGVAEVPRAGALDPRRIELAQGAALAPTRPIEVPVASPIHTPRFSLRPLAIGDREEFLRALRASPHVERFMPLRHPGERDEAVFGRHLELTRLGASTGQAWRRIAVDAAGRIVGGFNLVNIERGFSARADANWWVAGDALRQRIATECVYAILDQGLADAPLGLGLTAIEAHVQLENQASLKLIARVGLRDSGRSPQTLQVGGHWLLHRTYLKTVLDRA